MMNVSSMMMVAVRYVMNEIEDDNKFLNVSHSAIMDSGNINVMLVINAVINIGDKEYWDGEGKSIMNHLCEKMYIKDVNTKVNVSPNGTVVIWMKAKA